MVMKSVGLQFQESSTEGSSERLSVALVQYICEGGLTREAFLLKVKALLSQAVGQGARLVVFPELFTADLLPGGAQAAAAKPIGLTEEIAHWNRIIDQDVPAILESFQAMTREFHGVSVLFGSTPRRLPSGDIINSAPFVLSDGRFFLQDKLFVTPCEAREWKWKDGETLQVIEAPWGRTVILICHDIEVPGLSSMLVGIEPDLILTPSCTGSIHGLRRVRFCAQARAVEHHAWVLQTSTIQPAQGLGGVATVNMNEHTGQAAIIPPSESLYEDFRKEGPLNEGAIVFGELDFKRTRRVRQMPVVFPARDERARSRMPQVR